MCLAYLNINSIHNKLDLQIEGLTTNVDVIIISETKIVQTFPARQFHIDGYTSQQSRSKLLWWWYNNLCKRKYLVQPY